MRNLTVKRQKSFVGCLAKMKVYIEDASGTDLEINGVPCRKLGDLKNGEEKTFLVTESAARVYIIADKLSKQYCNEFYPLPEGDADVFLSGKNRFNPGAGNAFRFDGVTDVEVLENRKKGNKKGWIVLIVAIVVGYLLGSLIVQFLLSNAFAAKPKTFLEQDMQITLTDQFEEKDATGDFDYLYQSRTVVVQVFRENFAEGFGMEEWSTEKYAEVMVEVNEFDCEVRTESGFVCFDRSKSVSGKDYRYFSVILKGDDAFYYVEFICVESNFEDYRSDFIEWAKTIKLN